MRIQGVMITLGHLSVQIEKTWNPIYYMKRRIHGKENNPFTVFRLTRYPERICRHQSSEQPSKGKVNNFSKKIENQNQSQQLKNPVSTCTNPLQNGIKTPLYFKKGSFKKCWQQTGIIPNTPQNQVMLLDSFSFCCMRGSGKKWVRTFPFLKFSYMSKTKKCKGKLYEYSLAQLKRHLFQVLYPVKICTWREKGVQKSCSLASFHSFTQLLLRLPTGRDKLLKSVFQEMVCTTRRKMQPSS